MYDDVYEYLHDLLDDRAYEMAETCYGENPTQEQIEECRECLIDKWDI